MIFAPAGIVTVVPTGISSDALRWTPSASGLARPQRGPPRRARAAADEQSDNSDSCSAHASGYLIQQRTAGGEPTQVVEEVGDEAFAPRAASPPAVCGVMKQRGVDQSAWSGGKGSGSVTSR